MCGKAQNKILFVAPSVRFESLVQTWSVVRKARETLLFIIYCKILFAVAW